MAVTKLDPVTALIVIDLQKGIVTLPEAQAAMEVVGRARVLIDGFRGHGAPVVLVNVAGRPAGRTERGAPAVVPPADWTELVPELGRQAGDHLVTKRSWGAFTGTGLAEHLAERGVTQVVIAGIATSIGVESTARQAHELGFNVTLATDAMADLNPEAHANSIERIFPRLGETGSTAEILALLGAHAG